MGIRPAIFLSEMAEVDGVYSHREYEKLKRDWSRRKGPAGWWRKIAFEEKTVDVLSRQLTGIRQIQARNQRLALDTEIPAYICVQASKAYESAIEQERKILGITPLVQPEIVMPRDEEKLTARLRADQQYDLWNQVDPTGRLATEMVQRLMRNPELCPDYAADLERNR